MDGMPVHEFVKLLLTQFHPDTEISAISWDYYGPHPYQVNVVLAPKINTIDITISKTEVKSE
jgi:hypothetical protein